LTHDVRRFDAFRASFLPVASALHGRDPRLSRKSWKPLSAGRSLQNGNPHQFLSMIAEQKALVGHSSIRRFLRAPEADVQDIGLPVIVHRKMSHRELQEKWHGSGHGSDRMRL
jgi:hypothetical protein